MHKHFIGILQNQGDNQKYYSIEFFCKLSNDNNTPITKFDKDKEKKLKKGLYILEKRNEDFKIELYYLLLTEEETNPKVIDLKTEIRKNEFQINELKKL